MDKDEIILIVKKAIANNSIPFNDSDEFVELDCSDVDNIADEVYEALYNAGYRKTFTSDLASDTQKAFKEGYDKVRKETAKEILQAVDRESNEQTISITNHLRKKYGVEVQI